MAARKTGGLGRGLSALLSDSENVKTGQRFEGDAVHFMEIPVEQIRANPFQPRTHFEEEALSELAESIKIQGIIQPITVRRMDGPHYQLISGERRLQASKIAGLDRVPAYIRSANDQEMLEMALMENIQREDLNAIEVALSYQRLIDECGLKMEAVGDRMGKKRATVNNYLRLLRLPPDIQLAVRDRVLSMGHARALISIENVDQQLALYHRIQKEHLSVRQTESLASRFIGRKPQGSPGSVKGKTSNDPEIKSLENKLQHYFGTKVVINYSPGKKGTISIPISDEEDLERILELLNL